MAGNKLILVKNDSSHVTPANSTDWFTLPFTSASFTPDIQKAADNSVRTTRVEGAERITKMQETGSIDAELTYGVFDDLIASVFCNNWTADVLTSGGSVEQSFTAEEKRGNLTANQYIPHLVFIETMSLQADYSGESVSVSFGIKGGSPYEPAASSLVGTGTVSAETTKTKLIPSDIGILNVDGVAICVNSMSLTVTNTFIEVTCLTDIAPKAYRLGNKQKIEVTIDPELDDTTVAHYIKTLNNGTGTYVQEFVDPDDITKKYTLNLAEVGFASTIPAMTSADDLERMETTLTVQNTAATLTRIV